MYGASAYGFHNQFPDMTLEECEEFIEKFKAALPSIEAGQKASVRRARDLLRRDADGRPVEDRQHDRAALPSLERLYDP